MKKNHDKGCGVFVHEPCTCEPHSHPEIVCLCGSTRFKDAFAEATKRLTIGGAIVLSVGCFPHADDSGSPEESLGREVKARLDELHLRKVELANRVLVLNVGGYVGESTAREIRHAEALGKLVDYLEP